MSQLQTNQTNRPWSVRMAETIMMCHPILAQHWHYEPGLILLALKRLWEATSERRYFDYIQRTIDTFIDGGSIRGYRREDFNLDQINEGKVLFLLHAETGDMRYKAAADLLLDQLQAQPRTTEGGFWHKQIYPHQMWLDGIYMASPFLAEYGAVYGVPAYFDEVARQILLIGQRTRDPKTGLFYHAWDSSRSQRWANPETGTSPHFWGRAMGWYLMAIVDVLDFLPPDHPARAAIIALFEDAVAALARVQDAPCGVWWQVLDQGGRAGNYLEASASCMFVYAIARAVRKGYIVPTNLEVARKGYAGILEQFIEVDADTQVNLHRVCSVAGLGGTPYRSGTYEYYVGEPIASNDFKGTGPFILASLELEA